MMSCTLEVSRSHFSFFFSLFFFKRDVIFQIVFYLGEDGPEGVPVTRYQEREGRCDLAGGIRAQTDP